MRNSGRNSGCANAYQGSASAAAGSFPLSLARPAGSYMDPIAIVRDGNDPPGTGAIVPWRPVKAASPAPSAWVLRYGTRHRMQRVVTWPAGIVPPRKVRVYFRSGAFLLQWWEPKSRKNVAEGVVGDLVAAIMRAREIDQRLIDFKCSGQGSSGRRLRHHELVERFGADLVRRCDAGEIEPGSIRRYAGALNHYTAYVEQPDVQRRCPYVINAGREFTLAFGAFLASRRVSANGREAAGLRPMKGHAFVWDAVRAMYAWAADPDRGALLPDGFRNPFRRRGARVGPAKDLFGEPDITIDMAASFLRACDAYQLRLFAPMVFFGLRAEEPAYLFREYIEREWLRVPCSEILGYTTKGKRDKRLPLTGPLREILMMDGGETGLLYLRRRVAEGSEIPPLAGRSLEEVGDELRRRLQAGAVISAAKRQRLRDEVLHDAGATNYDRIDAEFRGVVREFHWGKQATLKDFRHLFLTSLANAGLAEPYRQYLAGQAQSTAPVMNYTHLNQVREQYERAVRQEWAPLVEALEARIAALGLRRP